MRRNVRAFTLIEMIVVTVILGIIATLLLPRLGSLTPRGRLRGAATHLVSLARHAADHGVSTRAMQTLILDSSSGAYRIDGGEEARLPDGIRIESMETLEGTRLGGQGVRIRFGPQGSADTAAIHLADGDGRRATVVVLGFTGRISAFNEHVPLRQAMEDLGVRHAPAPR